MLNILATQCPPFSLALTILYPPFDSYPSIALPLSIAMDKGWSNLGQTKVKISIGYPHQGGLWDLVTSYSATQVAPTAHSHQEGLLHICLGKFITLPWCPAPPNLTLAES